MREEKERLKATYTLESPKRSPSVASRSCLSEGRPRRLTYEDDYESNFDTLSVRSLDYGTRNKVKDDYFFSTCDPFREAFFKK